MDFLLCCGEGVLPELNPKEMFLDEELVGRNDFFCVGDVLEVSDIDSSFSLTSGLPSALVAVVLTAGGHSGLRPGTIGFLTG